MLRLIALKFCQTPVYLVTNILDPRELPNAAACQLYQLRWDIELQFRTIKQTFGRSKLRRAVPDQYQRTKESKKARNRPDNKGTPSVGKPVIVTAKRQHKLKLKQYLALVS